MLSSPFTSPAQEIFPPEAPEPAAEEHRLDLEFEPDAYYTSLGIFVSLTKEPIPRMGERPESEIYAALLRRSGKPVLLAVNKAEGRPVDDVVVDYYELGLDTPRAVSASHGDVVRALLLTALALVPGAGEADERPPSDSAPRIAVVGRPNVGKSTLINRLLGEERLVTRDEPGFRNLPRAADTSSRRPTTCKPMSPRKMW